MLTWISPAGFKSFDSALQPIDLSKLTMLVGANGSGKSNLLEAVRFFQGLAAGFSLIEITQGVHRVGREVWPGLRGGRTGLLNSEGATLRLQLGLSVGGTNLAYGIELTNWSEGVHRPLEVASEWLVNENLGRGIEIVNELNGDGVGRAVDGKYEPTSKNILFNMESHRSVLMGSVLPASIAHLVPDPEPLRRFLVTSQTLDLSPSRMREYSPPTAQALGSEGENLSAVLQNIVQQGRKPELLDWISELCVPSVSDIDFIEVPTTGDLLFVLIEEGGRRVTGQTASDGTIRFLGLIAALWSMPEGSLICLEEVERGLHPSRLDLLVEVMLQAVDSRGLQILATTHSPRILYALGERAPDILGASTVLGRSPETAATIASPLKSLPAFEDVLARRGIEYLFANRWLEQSL